MSDFNLAGSETKATGNANVGVVAQDDASNLVFDLSGVEEEKEFEVIPKGTYPAIVDTLDFGESKAGNPMITVAYSLTDAEFENRKIYDYWVLSGKGSDFGLGKLKKFLTRICPDVDITSFNPKTFADEGTGVARELQITLGIQTQKKGDYKGQKRNTVRDIAAAESAGSFL